MLVPSPAFRSMAPRDHGLGPLRAGRDADAAARRARQARPAGRQARRFPGRTAASTARRASPAGASCSGGGRSSSAASPWSCCSRWPCRCSAADRRCPRSRSCRRRTILAQSATSRCRPRFGPGAPGAAADRRPAPARRRRAAPWSQARPGHRRGHCRPSAGAAATSLIEAIPTSDPSSPRVGATIDRLRARAARRRAGRRPRGREPRPRSRAGGEDAAGDRRRPRRSASCCCWSPSRRRWSPRSASSPTCSRPAPPSASPS